MDNKARADRIAEFKAAYVYGTTGGLLLSGDPRRREMLESWNIPANGTSSSHRAGRSRHVIRLEDYFHQGDGRPSANLAILSDFPALMIIEAAALIKYDKTQPWPPDFEFLRLVRNAIAHDGLINVRHSYGPAEFDGIKISEEDNGRPLADIVAHGDMLALIDSVVEILRARME